MLVSEWFNFLLFFGVEWVWDLVLSVLEGEFLGVLEIFELVRFFCEIWDRFFLFLDKSEEFENMLEFFE